MPPMGDASFDAQGEDPMGGQMPPMDGGADPMGGGAPMGPEGDMGEEPMGADAGMGEEPMAGGEDMGGGSEIDAIYNKLSPESQKAAKAYAESLLKQATPEDEGETDDAMEGGDPSMGGEPMAEAIYKVKNGKLMEVFNCNSDEEDKKRSPEKKKVISKGNPFSSPLK